MGEAKSKTNRVKFMANDAVGPCEFSVDETSVLLISRSDKNSVRRFCSAISDIAQKGRLLTLIEALPESTLEKADWLVALLMRDGHGCSEFKLLSKHDKALGVCLNLIGEAMSARHEPWTAVVLGTAEDREAVKSEIVIFQDDVTSLHTPKTLPKLSIANRENGAQLLIEISRNEVESMDLSGVLLAADTFSAETRLIEKVWGKTTLLFDGYNEDPRPLQKIPAVLSFMEKLVLFAPWLPLCLAPENYLLWSSALDRRCQVSELEGGKISVYFSPDVIKSIQSKLIHSVADFFASRILEDIKEYPSVEKSARDWGSFLNNASAS